MLRAVVSSSPNVPDRPHPRWCEIFLASAEEFSRAALLGLRDEQAAAAAVLDAFVALTSSASEAQPSRENGFAEVLRNCMHRGLVSDPAIHPWDRLFTPRRTAFLFVMLFRLPIARTAALLDSAEERILQELQSAVTELSGMVGESITAA